MKFRATVLRRLRSAVRFAAIALVTAPVLAGPFAAPGDSLLRNDLELLNDTGVINIPLSSWPLAWGDIAAALQAFDADSLTGVEANALYRVLQHVRRETTVDDLALSLTAGAASRPRIVRTFDDTPRTNAELGVAAQWTGQRFAVNASVSQVSNPADGDATRFDGSHVDVALGNWILSAGWQERWWGPGVGGALSVSHNARPLPAVAIQRNRSSAFDSRWLRWIGPWTLNAFMGQLDDDRVIRDTLLFGVRVNFRPLRRLEIGLSRTAQWCGSGRPCNGSTFVDLLLGKDNQGVNVDPREEPGNQLAGIDFRWAPVANWPVAVYGQWVGEDSRRGGPEIGSWLRQAGIESWGSIGPLQHRLRFEVADTSCRAGGLGFSEIEPNCGYEHNIYESGYRYENRPLGHGMDGDGLSYSVTSTLVQSAGHSWNVSLRSMKINRVGVPDSRHSISAVPLDIQDLLLTHNRATRLGRFHIGIGLDRIDAAASDGSSTDVTGFLRWTSN